MYLNILKRDLKRKKTMNVILLIFVILSAMFMASSVNNIIAVTSGLDTFFEQSGMADHYVLALDDENDSLDKALDKLDSTTEYKREDIFYSLGSNVGSKSGNGLGLNICRQLTRAMGGDVFADIENGNMCVSVVCKKN